MKKPEWKHLLWLGIWPCHLLLYMITEKLVPAEKCYTVHCRLDDIIPFNEFFVIPYVIWYFLMVFTAGYLLLYNVKGFVNYSKFIFVTQLVAMACYVIFPTKQELRVPVLRDNICAQVVRWIQSTDTNTGVCPSLHVAYSIGIASAWVKEKRAHVLWKAFVVVMAVFICLSTMFLKQHSAVDFFAALPLCLLAEWIAYRKFYGEKWVQRKR